VEKFTPVEYIYSTDILLHTSDENLILESKHTAKKKKKKKEEERERE
jgi:hypothetical protein